MSNRTRRNRNINPEENVMSEEQQPQQEANEIEDSPAEEEPQVEPAEESPVEEKVQKLSGDRTDASGRSLFPWETSPKK